jgi:hypothetical protein
LGRGGLSCGRVTPLGCKRVYYIKVKSDGNLDRYKTRLVTLRNNQEYGVNYEESFALVDKMTSIHTMLVIATS